MHPITMSSNIITMVYNLPILLTIYHVFMKPINASDASTFTFTVTENSAIGNEVANVQTYRPLPPNFVNKDNIKIYSMEILGPENIDQKLFAIDPYTGKIYVSSQIDREQICPALSSTKSTCKIIMPVTIFNDLINLECIIVDENDNAPKFSKNTKELSIKESTSIGSNFFLEHAIDLDSTNNGIGQYELTISAGSNPFTLNYNQSVIYLQLNQRLDYEKTNKYHLTLSVCDLGNIKKCSSQQILIKIIDTNDHYPKFKQKKYVQIISEDFVIGGLVLQVIATDDDSARFGIVKYRFANPNNKAKRWFRLDQVSGKIYLLKQLTMKISTFNFKIEAFDNGQIPNVNYTIVTIHIKDINNNAPSIKIAKSMYDTTILTLGPHKSLIKLHENNPVNTDLALFIVTDKDSKQNAKVQCNLTDPNKSHLFRLNKFNINNKKSIYRLVALVSLDCEMSHMHSLVINCSDHGSEPRHSVYEIQIKVLDINEFAAKFNQSNYVASVRENVGSFSLSMPIIDKDCKSEYRVVINDNYVSKHFRYMRLTQRLVLYQPLDYERANYLNFTVSIINVGEKIDRSIRNFVARVEISVSDENDHKPYLIEPKLFRVKEDIPIGTVIGRLKANDSDSHINAQFQFYNLNKSQHYFLIGSDGEIRLAKELDRETKSSHHILVVVSDMGTPTLSNTEIVTIGIIDINDNNPQWIFPSVHDNEVNSSIHQPIGTEITRINAIDRDEDGQNNITYHLSNTNYPFRLDKRTGVLTNTKIPKEGKYVLNIVAVDNGKPKRSNRTNLILYLSNKNPYDVLGDGLMGSRSYFTIVAIVPVLILIFLLVLILCLLVVVKRRHIRTKNRRTHIKENCLSDVNIEIASINNNASTVLNKGSKSKDNNNNNNNNSNEQNCMLGSNKRNSKIRNNRSRGNDQNDNLLKYSTKMVELQSQHQGNDRVRGTNLENLDLTEVATSAMTQPKVNYQCLVTAPINDLEVCSADSGQGASEDDISHCMMFKHQQQQATMSGVDLFRFHGHKRLGNSHYHHHNQPITIDRSQHQNQLTRNIDPSQSTPSQSIQVQPFYTTHTLQPHHHNTADPNTISSYYQGLPENSITLNFLCSTLQSQHPSYTTTDPHIISSPTIATPSTSSLLINNNHGTPQVIYSQHRHPSPPLSNKISPEIIQENPKINSNILDMIDYHHLYTQKQ